MQGLEYDQEYIDFSKKPEWLFEKSPEGKVPVIDDDGEWVADSGDICAYLDEKYSDNIMGDGQIPGVAEKFFPSFVGFLKSSDDEAADKEAALVEQLKQLDTYLLESGPYLGGDEMKAADAMLVRNPISWFRSTFRCTAFHRLSLTSPIRHRTLQQHPHVHIGVLHI